MFHVSKFKKFAIINSSQRYALDLIQHRECVVFLAIFKGYNSCFEYSLDLRHKEITGSPNSALS